MNKTKKRLFIKGLCQSVMQDALTRVGAMPDDWDGHELRRYLADKFEHEAWTIKPKTKDAHYRKRLRAYRNAMATMAGL